MYMHKINLGCSTTIQILATLHVHVRKLLPVHPTGHTLNCTFLMWEKLLTVSVSTHVVISNWKFVKSHTCTVLE